MTLTLDIVSPTKLLLSKAVVMVVMPGYEGDLAAQPGHAPVITLLRGGVITLYEDGNATEKFFVAGGFAEIGPERCTILADEAVKIGEMDPAAAKTALTAAEAVWESVDKQDNDARGASLDRLQIARARVDAAA
jgi:F-type H+-transporting ATPase subunit epsilon